MPPHPRPSPLPRRDTACPHAVTPRACQAWGPRRSPNQPRPHLHGHIPAFGTSPPLGDCRVGAHRRAAPWALLRKTFVKVLPYRETFPPFFYRCEFSFCSITGEKKKQMKHPSRAGSARPEVLPQLVSALMTAPAAAAGGRAAIRKDPVCRGRSFGAGLIKRVISNIRGQRDELCLALLHADARGDLCHPVPPRSLWGRGWPPRGQRR